MNKIRLPDIRSRLSRRKPAAPREKGLLRSGGPVLEILLPFGWPENGAPVSWCLRVDGTIQQHGEIDDPAKLADTAGSARLVAWSPASETVLTRARIPTRNKNKILQALPYALEEQILGDLEHQQFIFETLEDGELAVAVTNKQRIRAWLDILSRSIPAPRLMCPAHLGLPLYDDNWSLLFSGNEIWVRTGRYSGFAFPLVQDLPPLILTAALKEARDKENAPAVLRVFNPPDEFDRGRWAQALGVDILVENKTIWESLHPDHCPFNMLQGEFTPRKQANTTFARLRPAALVLGIWLLGNIVAGVWEWSTLRAAEKAARQESIKIFKSSFPDAKAIVDPALQMKRKLDELKGLSGQFGDDDFLPLLAKASPALKGTGKARLSSLRYSDGRLTLNITVPDFQSLETLKNRLNSAGLAVEVLTANSGTTGVSSRLRLQSKS